MPNSFEPSLADQIRDLEERGVTTRPAQAEALGIPYSTFMRHLKAAGLTTRVDHKKWLPWVVAKEHHSSLEARYLRLLAQAAEQGPTKTPFNRGRAVRWAAELIAAGLDITYSPEQGFYTIPAPPDGGRLKRVHDAACKYIMSLA